MGRKAGRDRRVARQRTAAELRDRASRRADRETRCLLARADSLATSFSISNTAHLPLPAICTAPRQYSYPVTIDGRPAGRRADCWQLATVAAVAEPWEPAPGDETIEGNWGGAGGWSADLVRAWLAEAMETLHKCRGEQHLGWRTTMPDVVHQAALAYGWHELKVRVHATPAELARLDMVLDWLFLIEDIAERKAVVGVAMGMPLRRIARAIGCSHTQVAILERRAIEQLVVALNADVEG